MKRTPLLIILATILLTSCSTGSTPKNNPSLTSSLQNPLFVERYYDDLIERLVQMEIQQDPLLENEDKKKILEQSRRDALKKVKEAHALQDRGTTGHFVSGSEPVQGEALYLDNTLYFGPEFATYPGLTLQVFITTVVDPRDAAFPDPSALPLGPLQNPYGSQQFSVPPVEDLLLFRTVVLWDTTLERLYGFAQLSPS